MLQLQLSRQIQVGGRGGGSMMAMMAFVGVALTFAVAAATATTSIAPSTRTSIRRYDRPSQAVNFSSPPLLHAHPNLPQLIYYEFCL